MLNGCYSVSLISTGTLMLRRAAREDPGSYIYFNEVRDIFIFGATSIWNWQTREWQPSLPDGGGYYVTIFITPNQIRTVFHQPEASSNLRILDFPKPLLQNTRPCFVYHASVPPPSVGMAYTISAELPPPPLLTTKLPPTPPPPGTK